MDQETLFSIFKAKAEAAAAEIYRVAGVEEALKLIEDFLKNLEKEQETKINLVWHKGPLVKDLVSARKFGIKGEIHFTGFETHAPSADVGIAEADLAVADTGTLGQDATDVQKRYATTLPMINIILVPTNSLVSNLPAALERWGAELPSFLAFITGPSRTADIERVLTLGVHGPERLLIIFLDRGGE